MVEVICRSTLSRPTDARRDEPYLDGEADPTSNQKMRCSTSATGEPLDAGLQGLAHRRACTRGLGAARSR